jgi:hypothetical protein
MQSSNAPGRNPAHAPSLTENRATGMQGFLQMKAFFETRGYNHPMKSNYRSKISVKIQSSVDCISRI